MPTFCFRNKETNELHEKFMSLTERQQYLSDNPLLEVVPAGAPALVDPYHLGRQKPDQGFRDILRNIKSKHSRSNINIR